MKWSVSFDLRDLLWICKKCSNKICIIIDGCYKWVMLKKRFHQKPDIHIQNRVKDIILDEKKEMSINSERDLEWMLWVIYTEVTINDQISEVGRLVCISMLNEQNFWKITIQKIQMACPTFMNYNQNVIIYFHKNHMWTSYKILNETIQVIRLKLFVKTHFSIMMTRLHMGTRSSIIFCIMLLVTDGLKPFF